MLTPHAHTHTNTTPYMLRHAQKSTALYPEPDDKSTALYPEPDDKSTALYPEPDDKSTAFYPELDDKSTALYPEPDDKSTALYPEPDASRQHSIQSFMAAARSTHSAISSTPSNIIYMQA